jgi:hypothetical protein
LSEKIGKPYRLLSGSEWYYAVAHDAAVSSKKASSGANRFGLFGMNGKEWTECPADSACKIATGGDHTFRVARTL